MSRVEDWENHILRYLVTVGQSHEKTGARDADEIRDGHCDTSHTGPVRTYVPTADQGEKLHGATRNLHVLRTKRVKTKPLDYLTRKAGQRGVGDLGTDGHHKQDPGFR